MAAQVRRPPGGGHNRSAEQEHREILETVLRGPRRRSLAAVLALSLGLPGVLGAFASNGDCGLLQDPGGWVRAVVVAVDRVTANTLSRTQSWTRRSSFRESFIRLALERFACFGATPLKSASPARSRCATWPSRPCRHQPVRCPRG
jgi:hypothetical protein